MSKTDVYSWRVDPELKSALESAARAEKTSVAHLLDRIVTDWLAHQPNSGKEDKVQRRLHAAAAKTFGTIELGEGPYDAERVRQRVRARVRRRGAAQGPD